MGRKVSNGATIMDGSMFATRSELRYELFPWLAVGTAYLR